MAGGAAFLSPKVARHVIDGYGAQRIGRGADARARTAALTPREREVLGLVGEGLSNPEIAARLHLVEGTVKAYVSAVLDRLGVKNRVQAAIVAYEAGLCAARDAACPDAQRRCDAGRRCAGACGCRTGSPRSREPPDDARRRTAHRLDDRATGESSAVRGATATTAPRSRPTATSCG